VIGVIYVVVAATTWIICVGGKERFQGRINAKQMSATGNPLSLKDTELNTSINLQTRKAVVYMENEALTLLFAFKKLFHHTLLGCDSGIVLIHMESGNEIRTDYESDLGRFPLIRNLSMFIFKIF